MQGRNFQIHLSSKFKICILLVFLNEVKYNSISFIPPTKKCHPERKARYGEKRGEEAFSRRKSSAVNLFYLEFCLRSEGKLFISFIFMSAYIWFKSLQKFGTFFIWNHRNAERYNSDGL